MTSGLVIIVKAIFAGFAPPGWLNKEEVAGMAKQIYSEI
jgi:hypothetical protein